MIFTMFVTDEDLIADKTSQISAQFSIKSHEHKHKHKLSYTSSGTSTIYATHTQNRTGLGRRRYLLENQTITCRAQKLNTTDFHSSTNSFTFTRPTHNVFFTPETSSSNYD